MSSDHNAKGPTDTATGVDAALADDSDEKRLCQVYKGRKEEDMYLFVDQRDGLARVPQVLLDRIGDTHLVTTLVLTPQRRLARVQASRVLEAIREQGFYLQMPPPRHLLRDAEMEDLIARNEKLPQ